MAKTQQFTAQQVADALTQAKGFVSVTARNLIGVTHWRFRQ